MKIWIVSSSPFLDEFRKIAITWPENDEIVITPIARFGIGIRAFFAFYKEYKKINPDRILTDAGYFGTRIIIFINRFFKRDFKTVFYLRGNYWLEERGRRGIG